MIDMTFTGWKHYDQFVRLTEEHEREFPGHKIGWWYKPGGTYRMDWMITAFCKEPMCDSYVPASVVGEMEIRRYPLSFDIKANNYLLPLAGESFEMGPARRALLAHRIRWSDSPVFDDMQRQFWIEYWSEFQTTMIRAHMKAVGIRGYSEPRYKIVAKTIGYWRNRVAEVVANPARFVELP